MGNLPKVCVIGAGCSGTAATKALTERGIEADCYEATDNVGGLWVYTGNEQERGSSAKTAAYRSLHINTSRNRMEYSDYPMPSSFPDFPSHQQIASYFNSYVDHFGIRDRISFNDPVEHAELRPDGIWEVSTGRSGTQLYDAVVVANGHHWDARWPEPAFPGEFNGKQMHSHDYVDNAGFEGKNVVVLGMGNSAMDIAVETSLVANNVFLAARRGAHILPKYMLGRPSDEFVASPTIPFEIRIRFFRALHRLAIGRMSRYGMPEPDHKLGEAHPTISSEILSRVAHGEVQPKPNIAELCGDTVRFTDGSEEPVDVIVYCTGYRVSFPFFDKDFISAPDNDLPLFRRVFKPDVPSVSFIGLLQPLGAIMPLAEAQSQWVADYLRGEYALPDRKQLQRLIDDERTAMFSRYVASKRHTMQVDFDDYLHELAKERQRGAERARASGFALPI